MIPAAQIPKLSPRPPAAVRREIELALALLACARPTRPDTAAGGFRQLGELAAAVFDELNRSRSIREVG
jgi:hypothetical protein